MLSYVLISDIIDILLVLCSMIHVPIYVYVACAHAMERNGLAMQCIGAWHPPGTHARRGKAHVALKSARDFWPFNGQFLASDHRPPFCWRFQVLRWATGWQSPQNVTNRLNTLLKL